MSASILRSGTAIKTGGACQSTESAALALVSSDQSAHSPRQSQRPAIAAASACAASMLVDGRTLIDGVAAGIDMPGMVDIPGMSGIIGNGPGIPTSHIRLM